MPSQDDSPPKCQLCEVCSTIDFKSIAHPTRLCTKTRDKEPSASRIPLGTASDICERSDRCAFCNLVWRRLRSSYGSDANLDGRCDLYNKDLCISAFPGRGDGDIPDLQNLQQGLHAHIGMATVQFSPEEYFIGPVLPWQRSGFSEQGVRQIMHLQVAPRTPNQSTQPDESGAEESSVEDILKSVRVRRAAPEVDHSPRAR
ncbi:Het-domain-containing protein [Lasiodiplodia theobromae]|uniref:Het-domain-containing protein n=1 Tax=Lasiodiplodia theobromae TaxID=45133 RepID=UPI0015C33E03|nr:Het-domain-containing protein [Lasiodiplodia theobromae]KAF4546304.1 Het-domain-containing protein [Lasiodiplodia theobromae]